LYAIGENKGDIALHLHPDFFKIMSSIIQLLPEHVANQIAAGEVIQRPASAVKELLENAVDAGATHIQLIIKDGGRTLIQVIDNGSGMNEFDARMCFARHATSKIKQADDLWAIRTMGFRGEAMASIAAVAQVEMRTRKANDEVGTQIIIEGSEIKRQEPIACSVGTSISIKNLFFNVPARRNFLKSNPVETKHIFDEFQRIALAFPELSFSLLSQENEVYRLNASNHKQRIMGIFGANMNERLVNVKEETTVCTINGFIGKPQFARKTRGEQFFFINNRFIKNSYLHHAVQAAFEEIIQSDTYPSYFIWFEVDPKTIDINIHPTKTEVKFEDERSVYAILRSAIKRAIGTFSLSPSLDFETEQAFNILPNISNRNLEAPGIMVNPQYNPFSNPKLSQHERPDAIRALSQAKWNDLVGLPERVSTNLDSNSQIFPESSDKKIETTEKSKPWSLHGKYICSQIKSGMLMIDHAGALERILFERFTKNFNHVIASQQLLFPVVKEFSGADYELIIALQEELHALGFNFEPFGKHTIVINGIPAETDKLDPKSLIDQLLEQFKTTQQDLSLSRLEKLAKSLAFNAAKNFNKNPSSEQMSLLIDQLFACETTNYTPSGKVIVNIITLEELATKFNKNTNS